MAELFRPRALPRPLAATAAAAAAAYNLGQNGCGAVHRHLINITTIITIVATIISTIVIIILIIIAAPHVKK